MEMYMQKFGRNKAQTMKMGEEFGKNFSSVGLPYKFTENSITGNTINAHRLIAYSKQKGGVAMQDIVMEELFRNYFAEEKFLNDPEVLKAAAIKGGFTTKEAAGLVDDSKFYLAETMQEMKVGRDLRVRGVPHFVCSVEGQKGPAMALSGAQPSEAFEEAFADLLA